MGQAWEDSFGRRFGVGISLFLGGGLATYLVVRYVEKRKKTSKNTSTEELSLQLAELKREIQQLNRILPHELEELKLEIENLRTSLMRRRPKSSSNISLMSYKTAYSDGEVDDIDDNTFRVLKFADSETVVYDSEAKNEIANEGEKRAFYARIDTLYNGTDEEKETAMRLLQDNEIGNKNDPEFLWRLGRSHISVHEMRTELEEKKVHAFAGLDYTKRSLDAYEASSDAHKWHAISLGTITKYVHTKEKILNGFKLRDHVLRALELNPTEPTLYFMMGRWCWEISMLSWIERKLAATIFATPPTSSFDQALEYFLKAEELEAGFYKSNQLYIAKCYYQMSNYSETRRWLESAKLLEILNSDDRKTHSEVLQLLESL